LQTLLAQINLLKRSFGNDSTIDADNTSNINNENMSLKAALIESLLSPPVWQGGTMTTSAGMIPATVSGATVQSTTIIPQEQVVKTQPIGPSVVKSSSNDTPASTSSNSDSASQSPMGKLNQLANQSKTPTVQSTTLINNAPNNQSSNGTASKGTSSGKTSSSGKTTSKSNGTSAQGNGYQGILSQLNQLAGQYSGKQCQSSSCTDAVKAIFNKASPTAVQAFQQYLVSMSGQTPNYTFLWSLYPLTESAAATASSQTTTGSTTSGSGASGSQTSTTAACNTSGCQSLESSLQTVINQNGGPSACKETTSACYGAMKTLLSKAKSSDVQSLLNYVANVLGKGVLYDLYTTIEFASGIGASSSSSSSSSACTDNCQTLLQKVQALMTKYGNSCTSQVCQTAMNALLSSSLGYVAPALLNFANTSPSDANVGKFLSQFTDSIQTANQSVMPAMSGSIIAPFIDATSWINNGYGYKFAKSYIQQPSIGGLRLAFIVPVGTNSTPTTYKESLGINPDGSLGNINAVSWGAYATLLPTDPDIINGVNELKASGAKIAISFGGEDGLAPGLISKGSSDSTDQATVIAGIKKLYKDIIELYGPVNLDFDVENAAESYIPLFTAIAELQGEYPGLSVTLTVSTDIDGMDAGTSGKGWEIVKQAKAKGLKFVFNAMAQYFGSTQRSQERALPYQPASANDPALTYAQYVIQSIYSSKAQLDDIYGPGGFSWSNMATVPYVNDKSTTKNADNVTVQAEMTPEDMKVISDFGKSKGMAFISYWDGNKDSELHNFGFAKACAQSKASDYATDFGPKTTAIDKALKTLSTYNAQVVLPNGGTYGGAPGASTSSAGSGAGSSSGSANAGGSSSNPLLTPTDWSTGTQQKLWDSLNGMGWNAVAALENGAGGSYQSQVVNLLKKKIRCLIYSDATDCQPPSQS
jgi:hypothetical protein